MLPIENGYARAWRGVRDQCIPKDLPEAVQLDGGDHISRLKPHDTGFDPEFRLCPALLQESAQFPRGCDEILL